MGEEFQFGFPKVIQAYARGASVESSFSRNPPPNRTDANLIFGAPFIALGAVFGSQAIWGYNRSRRLRSSERTLLMDWRKNGVKIVHADELDTKTPQTPGMTRAAAITHATAGATTLWAGTMVVQPDAKTGQHHHGELETFLYALKGRVRMRWGDRLELSDEAGAGDFIYVPPYVPHQEINADPNKTCEAVVVRNGQDPIVLNLRLHTPTA